MIIISVWHKWFAAEARFGAPIQYGILCNRELARSLTIILHTANRAKRKHFFLDGINLIKNVFVAATKLDLRALVSRWFSYSLPHDCTMQNSAACLINLNDEPQLSNRSYMIVRAAIRSILHWRFQVTVDVKLTCRTCTNHVSVGSDLLRHKAN